MGHEFPKITLYLLITTSTDVASGIRLSDNQHHPLCHRTRRVYVRIAALEALGGPGLPVLTADGQVGLAYMSSLELEGLSEKATRLSYGVVIQIAANLAGGIHMLRVGDGAH